MINLVKKVAQNVAPTLEYYIFLQLEASKSSPIDKKSPNLVTLLITKNSKLQKKKSFITSTPWEKRNSKLYQRRNAFDRRRDETDAVLKLYSIS